jgi:hypothetical protein
MCGLWRRAGGYCRHGRAAQPVTRAIRDGLGRTGVRQGRMDPTRRISQLRVGTERDGRSALVISCGTKPFALSQSTLYHRSMAKFRLSAPDRPLPGCMSGRMARCRPAFHISDGGSARSMPRLVTVGINHENRGFASRSRIPSCRQCCPNPSRSNRIVDVQTAFRQSSHQALGCGKFQHGFARHVSLTQGDSHSLPAIGRGQLRLAQEFPIKFETIDLDSAAAAGCLKHVSPLACRRQYITPAIGGLFRRPQSPFRANRIT